MRNSAACSRSERGQDVLRDVAEQRPVLLGVAPFRVVALHDDAAADDALVDHRHAHPVLGIRAERIVARHAQLPAHRVGRTQHRLAVADQRQRQAVLHLRGRQVLVRIRHHRVLAVGEVDEPQRVRLRRVADDVEVLGVHQPADDLVQAFEHDARVLAGARQVGDREQRALQPLGAAEPLDVDPQPLDLGRQRSGVVRARPRRQGGQLVAV